MNGIAIKDITGALVDKESVKHHRGCACRNCWAYFCRDEALTQQGQVKITLNKEKLAVTLNKFCHEYYSMDLVELDKINPKFRTEMYKLADAIIAELKNLLEVVK